MTSMKLELNFLHGLGIVLYKKNSNVLDEIWDLIESVSEGFHSYSLKINNVLPLQASKCSMP